MPHYHVDWRFMSSAERRDLKGWKGKGFEKGVVVWAADVVRFELQHLVYRAPASEWAGTTIAMQLRTVLEPLHVGSSLPPTRRCPHRGADLTHCKPDADGIVTCPMHGLRWHTDTGKLAPTTNVANMLAQDFYQYLAAHSPAPPTLEQTPA